METIEYKGYTIELDYDSDAIDPRENDCNLCYLAIWHRRYNLGDPETPDTLERLMADMLLSKQPTDDQINAMLRSLLKEKDYLEQYKDFYLWMRSRKYKSSRIRAEFAINTMVEDIEDLTPEQRDAVLEVLSSQYVIKPLYLYDHSNLVLSTAPFSCPWDSGQVGYAFCDIAALEKEFGVGRYEPVTVDGEVLCETLLGYADKIIDGEVSEYSKYINGETYFASIKDSDGEFVDSCGGLIGYNYTVEVAKEKVDHLALTI